MHELQRVPEKSVKDELSALGLGRGHPDAVQAEGERVDCMEIDLEREGDWIGSKVRQIGQ